MPPPMEGMRCDETDGCRGVADPSARLRPSRHLLSQVTGFGLLNGLRFRLLRKNLPESRLLGSRSVRVRKLSRNRILQWTFLCPAQGTCLHVRIEPVLQGVEDLTSYTVMSQ